MPELDPSPRRAVARRRRLAAVRRYAYALLVGVALLADIARSNLFSSGSRYKTHGAPDRKNPAVFAVILAVLAIAIPVHIVMQRPVLELRR